MLTPFMREIVHKKLYHRENYGEGVYLSGSYRELNSLDKKRIMIFKISIQIEAGKILTLEKKPVGYSK